MAETAIVLFILTSTVGLFALPFVVKRFHKNDFVDLVIKRCCWIIALYLMTLNSAIVATIANLAAIPIENEMFMYMYIFGIFGYLFIVYTVITTIFDLLELYKSKKRKERLEE